MPKLRDVNILAVPMVFTSSSVAQTYTDQCNKNVGPKSQGVPKALWFSCSVKRFRRVTCGVSILNVLVEN